jgi:signal transduction histidine kinase
VSLVDTGRHGKDDEVWLGSSSLDRHLAVCGCTFNSTYTVMDENGNAAKHNALVVEDMREDPRFRDREYVKNGSVLFYAGVPIRTRNGVRIGVYAVSNNEPRKPLNAMELSFMQDVAEAVMEHLELSKSKNDSIKGERVAKGLTSFIEGYSFYDEAAVETEMSVRSDFYEEGPRRPKSKQPDATATKKTEVNGLFNRAARIIRESTLASGVVFLDASSQFIPVGPIVENLESDASGTEHMNDTENSGGDAHEGRVSFRLSRPNKTLSLGGESNPDTDRKMSASDSDASPTRAATSDVLGIDVLANNLNLTSSTAHFPVSKKDLKTCIQRYPAGKVFSMFEDSTTSSGDDTTDASEAKSLSQSTRSRRRKSSLRRTMADEILRQLPGVQSVVFLPLWDSSGEKWLAGCFMWTTETGKLTDAEDELPFLKAFANSITSEYARIQAQFSERAKTTFIASISHELRSPLHGILGSIEFLHDTNIDSDQKSLVGNIEMAGKTLLDTINHVLDFAKINDFSTGKESAGAAKSSHARTTSGKDMSLNLVAEFDLSLLVEEVTEAIYAGRIFNRQRRADRVKNTGVRKIPSRIQSRTDGVGDEISTSDTEVVPSNVAIILNINKDENWNVRAQPGALRRVIMVSSLVLT